MWANNVYVLSTTIGLLVVFLLWPKKPQPAELAVAAEQTAEVPSPVELGELEAEEPVRVSAAVRELVIAVQRAAERDEAERVASEVAEAEAWLADELERLGVLV